MREISVDEFDIAILRHLQRDASLTHAQLSDRVHLSASQCSRRRAALESAGLIRAIRAELDGPKLGYGFRAITRVVLARHNAAPAEDFHRFLATEPAIQAAHSVSGDADYVLEIIAKDLTDFADFIHLRLLPQKHVAQVRSEIVLKTLKAGGGVPL